MYKCYLCDELMPITPAKLTLEIRGKNKNITLLNEGEITFLKSPGLTRISFEVLLPMLSSNKKPDYYLSLFERVKVGKKPTQLILIRNTPSGKKLFDTNIKVSIEDYRIKEDASEGMDIFVEITLLQYRDFGTKKISLKKVTESGKKVVSTKKDRETSKAPTASNYVVKKGDCLWTISGKLLGSPTRWKEIYELNKDKISDPNIIAIGLKLRIPKR